MSALTATQIPKPRDEQAFEDGMEVLWRLILNDPTAQRYGRRGQRQHGVDIVGCRDRVPNNVIGIQCRLKGEGGKLEEEEIRNEVEKALGFRPHLSEYVIVTTAPDDAQFQTLALELSQSASRDREENLGVKKDLKVSIFGWGTLEREILRYPEAVNAFDPSHTPWGNRIEQIVGRRYDSLDTKVDTILTRVTALQEINPVVDSTTIQTVLDRQISDIAEVVHSDPATALDLLKKLQQRLDDDTSDRIRYRVAANVAVCQLELGEQETAAQGFVTAYDLAPDDPKAIANKAFGLLLQEDWPSLRAFAKDRLPLYPENATLAACYIHALIYDRAIEAPLAHVPTAVHGTAAVAEAHVRWVMHRGDHGAWWDAASAAYKAHPDIVGLKELYASSLLEQAINAGKTSESQVPTHEKHTRIQEAIGIYEALWAKIRDSSGKLGEEQTSIPFNLMSAYRMLGQSEKAIEIGTVALACFPDNVSIKEHLAPALVEHGEMSRALDLISGLEVNSRTAVIRYHIALATEDWHALSALVEEYLETFPETERNPARAAKIVAYVELADAQDRRAILEEQKDNFTGDTRGLARLAECARHNGFDDLARDYVEAAHVALKGGDNTFPSRVSLAIEAMAQKKPRIAADVLIGHVPLAQENIGLELLSQALVYDYPIRERAIRFFSDLPIEIRSLPLFQQLEGILHINRGVPRDAIGPFSAAFEQQPSIENLMNLIRASVSVGNKEAAAALVERDDVDTLPGPASARIEFCQALLDLGQSARALDLGYRTVVEGLEQATVVMRFLGLVLRFCHNRPTDYFDGIVAPGVWVRLTQMQGDSYEALLGEADDRPWGAKADPLNAFFAKAVGRKVGDVFKHVNPVTDIAQTWTIAEVKPRWLQAFHHLSKTFNQSFPEAQGFATVPVNENDVQPALDMVRRRGEGTRALADLYLVNNLPLAFVAGDRPGASVSLAEYLASIGEDVRVCNGTVEEQTEALALVDQHRRGGAVLDALTAWHAALLRVFPVLDERLGRLAIPASELHRLKVMLEHQEGMVGKETMRLAYQNDQFIRHIVTPEEHAEQLTLIKSLIGRIEEACENEPLVIPDNLSELGEALVGMPFRDAVAPAVMAGQNRLMLSEDMMMRQLAGRAYGTKGVWLQAVLLSAVQAGKMPLDAYVESLVHLASHRHGVVPISLPVLLAVFERDTGDELIQIQALCTYIGQKDAEPASHIALAAAFINRVWETASTDDLKVMKATDLLFTALLRCDPTLERASWPSLLYRSINEAPRAYLLVWCREHSLPIGDNS